MPDTGADPGLPQRELDQQKVAAARLWACRKWPYLAHALLAMQPVPASDVENFAVDDQWRIYLDPARVNEWTTSQLGFVFNHEMQHLLRDHAGRARASGVSREQRKKWSVAADAEINDDLIADMSADDIAALTPVIPQDFDCEPGKLAEYYFNQIEIDESETPDEGSGTHGHEAPWESGDEGLGNETSASVSAVEAEMIRQRTAEAILAEDEGHGSAGLERWARVRLGQQQDWRRHLGSVLRSELARAAGLADYSYRRLSRRAGAVPNVVLPAMVKSQCDVTVVVDTSASVREAELGDALREVRSIAKLTASQGGTVQVLACDAAAARSTTSFKAEVALTGGGGTDMREGIAAALCVKPRPSVVIVLTDGITPWPESPPSVPVIIGLLGNRGSKRKPPTWATVVPISQI